MERYGDEASAIVLQRLPRYLLWEYDKSGDVNYGWIRRLLLLLCCNFWKIRNFWKKGPNDGILWSVCSYKVMRFIVVGVVYTGAESFLSLLLPENSDFWSATENNGPWDKN